MTITTAVRTGAHNNGGSSSTTCVATLSANTAGNCVIVGAGWVDVSGSVTCAVTDDKGNTYTAIGSKSRNASQQYSVQLFICSSVVASASTVTITATISTGAAFSDIKVEEISSTLGFNAGSLIAVNTTMTSGTGNSTALATTAATPTKNNCAIFTYGGANSGTITAGTGFTLRTTGADGLGLADLVQTTAASKAGLLTTSVSSQWTIVAAAIEEKSPAYAASSTSAGGFSASTKTITIPSGVVADDIIVLMVYRENDATAVTVTNFLKPSDGSSGFDVFTNTDHRLSIGWKRATGSESGSYTVNFGAGNEFTEVACLRIPGCIASGNPWDQINSSIKTTASTTSNTVAVTTTLENELLVFVGTNFTGGAYTPSGYTERTDVGGALTTGTQAIGTAAASGNKSVTCAGSGRMTAWLGSLKPYAGAAAAFDMKKASQFLGFFEG